ncbi:hypothetical protein DFH94DRAFT_782682 [Russula ochroleuca]|jgi:hypothetical protein|uniref:Uncharacterized protein n=1 Tax=Russula ochroleuca TaxID=152965 RepID=A0A9P5MNQ0_9AGAM|nr:hypothetical protein DFH94DRAFT_782682 [Russula ochroleuca]
MHLHTVISRTPFLGTLSSALVVTTLVLATAFDPTYADYDAPRVPVFLVRCPKRSPSPMRPGHDRLHHNDGDHRLVIALSLVLWRLGVTLRGPRPPAGDLWPRYALREPLIRCQFGQFDCLSFVPLNGCVASGEVCHDAIAGSNPDADINMITTCYPTTYTAWALLSLIF